MLETYDITRNIFHVHLLLRHSFNYQAPQYFLQFIMSYLYIHILESQVQYI